MWLGKVMIMMMKFTYSYSFFKERNLVMNDVFLNEIGKEITDFIELA
jgi:hypothetical protein